MTGEHPTKFYVRMKRNLGILRDIQRLIDDGRKSYRNTIEFDDEKGNVWKLQKVGFKKRKNPATQAEYLSSSHVKPTSTKKDTALRAGQNTEIRTQETELKRAGAAKAEAVAGGGDRKAPAAIGSPQADLVAEDFETAAAKHAINKHFV